MARAIAIKLTPDTTDFIDTLMTFGELPNIDSITDFWMIKRETAHPRIVRHKAAMEVMAEYNMIPHSLFPLTWIAQD